MSSIARTAAAAAVLVMLAGCGGGGGGGGGGPMAPPASSPPPSPPPPTVVGESPSGGTVSSNNAYAGDFRGPLSLLSLDASSTATLEVSPKTAAGPNDVSLDVSTALGANGQPTVTLFFRGETIPINLATAQVTSASNGFLDGLSVTTTAGGVTWTATQYDFDFNGRTREYSRLFLFQRATVPGTPPLAGGAISFGADEVAMPASGSATFATGVVGYYAAPSSSSFTQFIGEAVTSVNFGTAAMTATFADVDFVSGSSMVETAGGADFGLVMNATVSGDDFAGTMTTTGATAMAGQVQGDFYGPLNAPPSEIGGAFAIQGAGGSAYGGLQGVCTCITGP